MHWVFKQKDTELGGLGVRDVRLNLITGEQHLYDMAPQDFCCFLAASLDVQKRNLSGRVAVVTAVIFPAWVAVPKHSRPCVPL